MDRGRAALGDIATGQCEACHFKNLREVVSTPKAKATRERNAAGTTSAGGESTELPAKKPRTLEDKSGKEDMGAAENDDRMAVADAAAQEEPYREAGAEGLPPKLFRQGTPSDHALIE